MRDGIRVKPPKIRLHTSIGTREPNEVCTHTQNSYNIVL